MARGAASGGHRARACAHHYGQVCLRRSMSTAALHRGFSLHRILLMMQLDPCIRSYVMLICSDRAGALCSRLLIWFPDHKEHAHAEAWQFLVHMLSNFSLELVWHLLYPACTLNQACLPNCAIPDMCVTGSGSSQMLRAGVQHAGML